MQWQEVRAQYPEQWLIIEALEAHTEAQNRWLDQIAVLESCVDGGTAHRRYRALHQQYPQREFYFIHTSRETPDIRVREWLGIRSGHALQSA